MRDDLGRSLTDLDGISATFDAILRLSRMQAGLVSLQVEAFDIVPLVRDLAEMLAPFSRRRRSRLHHRPAANCHRAWRPRPHRPSHTQPGRQCDPPLRTPFGHPIDRDCEGGPGSADHFRHRTGHPRGRPRARHRPVCPAETPAEIRGAQGWALASSRRSCVCMTRNCVCPTMLRVCGRNLS